MTGKKRKVGQKDLRKEIILRAIASPSFRNKLLKNPESVLGKRVSKADKIALNNMKKSLPAIKDLVDSLSSTLLCTGGGGCPGLA